MQYRAVLEQMKVVDIFCGCGGLSLGATKAGFEVALSVDIDPILTDSYETNFGSGRLHLADVAELSGADIVKKVAGPIDGVIGGPPCQGFSEIGRADVDDPRRGLLRHFFRLVAEIGPSFFMMENVRGLTFPKNREILVAALEAVTPRYDIVGPLALNSAAYGAATKRPRVFIFGYDRTRVDQLTAEAVAAAVVPPTTVRDAIGDLSSASFLRMDDGGFDLWGHHRHLNLSPYAARLRDGATEFTSHSATIHTAAVAARFASVAPGTLDSVGRHPRLSWDGQCPTIRAGTGSDRGSYQAVRPLHPDEPRVITVREAARLQGFPDWFRFHETTWHSFRMIGNSVSPVIAEALLLLVRRKLSVIVR